MGISAALKLQYEVSKPRSGTACAGNTENPSNYRMEQSKRIQVQMQNSQKYF